MKRKTYNNVLNGVKMVMKKGYSKEEATDIVIKIFDQHENGEMPIEFWIDKIITKEEFELSYQK